MLKVGVVSLVNQPLFLYGGGKKDSGQLQCKELRQRNVKVM